MNTQPAALTGQMRTSLSTFAGQPVLLELITDPDGSNCDWAHWADLLITAEAVEPNGDVNRTEVNVLDLILVAQSFGKEPPDNPRQMSTSDGVVNLLDLVFVASISVKTLPHLLSWTSSNLSRPPPKKLLQHTAP